MVLHLSPISLTTLRVDAFHDDVFHGFPERDGKTPPDLPLVFANTISFTNLLISRSGRNVPEVFQPDTHLVVSERYAERLKRFSHIRLAPVIFKRLVDIDYPKGDMSWNAKWGDIGPSELVRELPDVVELHRQIGPYFEVQCYRWRDVVAGYPAAAEYSITVGTPPLEEKTAIPLSPEMLGDFPILRARAIIVHEEVLHILGPVLDRDFFLVREYDFRAGVSS